MNIQQAPIRTPALEPDKSGVFNRIWSRWFSDLYAFIINLRDTKQDNITNVINMTGTSGKRFRIRSEDRLYMEISEDNGITWTELSSWPA